MIRDKIIIVEDDPGISKYLQAALRSHEYDTLLAPDGKTALEMIASHCPDLLLLAVKNFDTAASLAALSTQAAAPPAAKASPAMRREGKRPGSGCSKVRLPKENKSSSVPPVGRRRG